MFDSTTDFADLRPAPRVTPTGILWAMFFVAVCGTGLLLWSVEVDDHGTVAMMDAAANAETLRVVVPEAAITKPATPTTIPTETPTETATKTASAHAVLP